MYLQKEWLLAEDITTANKEVDLLNLADKILWQRGFRTEVQRKEYYNTELSNMHDPFLFRDMRKACDLIVDHGKAGNLIVVYGDYDADGITATALLLKILKKVNFTCDYYIPDRLSEGYSLSADSVEKIIAQEAKLVITVDCGIASVAEVEALKSAGVDVIVTDHHECKDALPAADALINPKVPGCSYPYKELAGVGVALKLMQALDMMLLANEEWQQCLSLVALGTVADVVPLTGENRVIVKHGLSQFNSNPENVPIGVRTLIGLCQKQESNVNSFTLGFILAPRLNAAGRMGSPESALRLLLTTDRMQALQDAQKLYELNETRKKIEQEVLDEALIQLEGQRIEGQREKADSKILVIAGENWHKGILGIVSSKLAEMFYRPVIMLTRAGGAEECLHGSCRSYGDFDILAALEAVSDHLLSFGGHKKAAGLRLALSSFDDFVLDLELYAHNKAELRDLRPQIRAEMLLTEQDLTRDAAKFLERLEPYGEENRQPLFIVKNFRLEKMRPVGNGRHFSMTVSGPTGKFFDAIALGMSEADKLFSVNDQVDLLFALSINDWYLKERLQLQIRDIKHSESGKIFIDQPWQVNELYQQTRSIEFVSEQFDVAKHDLLPETNEYKSVYQYFKTNFENRCIEADLKILALSISLNYGISLSAFKLARIIDVFNESNLTDVIPLGEDRYRLCLLPVQNKVKLEEAPTFKLLYGRG